MGAHFARNDFLGPWLDSLVVKYPGGIRTQAKGQRPKTFRYMGKSGAVDGTRTRDPRRDRPVL